MPASIMVNFCSAARAASQEHRLYNALADATTNCYMNHRGTHQAFNTLYTLREPTTPSKKPQQA
jgi:hypothetical protein